MFTTPIKYTRLKSMEEVLNFSYRTNSKALPMKRWQNNGQIAFSDNLCEVYITPYRPEIHAILEESGYEEEAIPVPFSDGGKCPNSYQWLKQIAEEECWAYTHEKAFNVSVEKGIKPVKVSGKYQIKEIFHLDDTETGTTYMALVQKYLLNELEDNVGTYIIVDKKTIVICDEYGRTFLLRAKTVINDLVNTLIDAGYTRTIHPERYVLSIRYPTVTLEEE